MTTRIYPARLDSVGYGLWVSEATVVSYSDISVWDMSDVNVWPDRPRNSSSQLVFDTPEETNNYVWWSGN